MNTPLVRALGAALFHFLWQGAVLALALATCRKVSSQTRYRFACVAFFAMPVAFFTTLFLLLPEAGIRFPVQTGWNALMAGSSSTGGPVNPGGLTLERLQMEMRWFVPFWIAGMAFFCLRNLGSWVAVQRLRKAGAIAAPAFWQNRLNELAKLAGVRGVVTLLESWRVDVPVVAGFLRPVIFVPAGLFTGMPAEHLEYLLLHELAHVRRFDYAVNLLQKAVEGLLFFHPAVWWISGVLRQERENCCDDVVLAQSAKAGDYAIALAAMEQGRPEFAVAANGGDLSDRIRRILRNSTGTSGSGAPLLSVALLAFSLTVVFVAFQTPRSLAAQTAVSPWEKWASEDVAYLIRADERAVFTALRDDAEREHFVEQFWAVRAFGLKPEHYRRIAYSNEHFGGGGLPGWKTDRGRIYITFGPPDEIDAHPSGDAGGAPWQEWRFRHLEDIGNDVVIMFRDTNRNGLYAMTKDPVLLDTPVRRFKK